MLGTSFRLFLYSFGWGFVLIGFALVMIWIWSWRLSQMQILNIFFHACTCSTNNCLPIVLLAASSLDELYFWELFLFGQRTPLAGPRRTRGIRLTAGSIGQQVRPGRIHLQHSLHRRDWTRKVHARRLSIQYQLRGQPGQSQGGRSQVEGPHVRVGGEQRQTKGAFLLLCSIIHF